jgi:hypothetical protein
MAGFILTATIRPDELSAWIGNALFASVAILLLIVTGRVVARETRRQRFAHRSDQAAATRE